MNTFSYHTTLQKMHIYFIQTKNFFSQLQRFFQQFYTLAKIFNLYHIYILLPYIYTTLAFTIQYIYNPHLIEKTQECGNLLNKLYPFAPSQYYYRYYMYVFAQDCIIALTVVCWSNPQTHRTQLVKQAICLCLTGLPDNRLGTFRNYFRMTRHEFQYILASVEGDISKAAMNRIPISAEERLMVSRQLKCLRTCFRFDTHVFDLCKMT